MLSADYRSRTGVLGDLARAPPCSQAPIEFSPDVRFEAPADDASSYFGARYLASDVGRFTTVDPVYTWKENLVDPQRWNRYVYVRNTR